MIKDIFGAIGAFTVFLVVWIIIIYVAQFIHEFIDGKKYEHQYKHRFDKPPTAKCYCADCKYWWKENGSCSQFTGYHTADCWFCWKAEPMNHHEYNRRESFSAED